MKKCFGLFTLLILSYALVFGQVWTVRYNGTANGDDAIKSMVTDNAGNVYETGYSYSGGSNYDYLTIKYNNNGVQQWQARYNGPPATGTDQANAVAVDNAGNVYVTGYSYQQAFYGNMDVATVKYNSQGVQQWVARYDGVQKRADNGTVIRTDASGNVIVAGWTTDTHASYARKDFLVIKYNSTGVQQWAATYNGPGNKDDVAVGLALDAAGNVYVTGTSYAGEYAGQNDFLTIKFNPQGVQQWIQRLNGPANGYDYVSGLVLDQSGNVYVSGSSLGNGTDQDYMVIKYNGSGILQWKKTYDGPGHGYDISHALAVDNTGNVFVTGESQSATFKTDYCTVKYNSSGALQWVARYNGPSNDNDVANAIATDASGGVCVTGDINGTIDKWDMTTVKYSAAGAQQWVKRYDGPGHKSDAGYATGVDQSGNVYVAGSSTGISSGMDYVTIKYGVATSGSRPTADNDEAPVTQPSLLTITSFPNPFVGSTKIRFNIPTDGHVRLNIFSSLGNRVAVLVDEKLIAGNYEVEWAPKKIAPGSYFYLLSAGSTWKKGKMILIE